MRALWGGCFFGVRAWSPPEMFAAMPRCCAGTLPKESIYPPSPS